MSSHFISLNQAIAMTTLFRANRESILNTTEQGKDILFISETFDRDAFDYLLAESGAAGLRFYLGMDEDLKVRIVAVATDENGIDILPAVLNANLANPLTGAKIVEVGQRCPPTCPPPGSGLGG